MPPTPQPRIVLDLSLEEANLVLEALGQLPFARVYELVSTVQQQAQKQLANEAKPTAVELVGAASGRRSS